MDGPKGPPPFFQPLSPALCAGRFCKKPIALETFLALRRPLGPLTRPVVTSQPFRRGKGTHQIPYVAPGRLEQVLRLTKHGFLREGGFALAGARNWRFGSVVGFSEAHTPGEGSSGLRPRLDLVFLRGQFSDPTPRPGCGAIVLEAAPSRRLDPAHTALNGNRRLLRIDFICTIYIVLTFNLCNRRRLCRSPRSTSTTRWTRRSRS